MASLEEEISTIKARNIRVEADKAWERSGLRIGSITAITYIIAGLVLWTIGSASPWRDALIPTVGYFLSTQSLPAIKAKWIERYTRKRNQ